MISLKFLNESWFLRICKPKALWKSGMKSIDYEHHIYWFWTFFTKKTKRTSISLQNWSYAYKTWLGSILFAALWRANAAAWFDPCNDAVLRQSWRVWERVFTLSTTDEERKRSEKIVLITLIESTIRPSKMLPEHQLILWPCDKNM